MNVIKSNAGVIILALGAISFPLCFSAQAQQAGKIPRIGYLGSTGSDRSEEFRQTLRGLGYIEGKNIQFEYRFIETAGEGSQSRDANGPGPTIAFKAYEAAAQLQRIKLQSLEIRELKLDFKRAFNITAKDHASAILPIRSGALTRNREQLRSLP